MFQFQFYKQAGPNVVKRNCIQSEPHLEKRNRGVSMLKTLRLHHGKEGLQISIDKNKTELFSHSFSTFKPIAKAMVPWFASLDNRESSKNHRYQSPGGSG